MVLNVLACPSGGRLFGASVEPDKEKALTILVVHARGSVGGLGGSLAAKNQVSDKAEYRERERDREPEWPFHAA
jgi:hypothetical protein